MPNQRSDNKTQMSCWVQDIKELDAYCERTGKTRTEVVQELINELKEKRRKAKS
tara:strand:+ start:407 stop:568 length:162 start_codon:yes stop_codon:yes gene_type:complete